MSDDILSAVPTDPYWQPRPDDAQRLAELAATLVHEPTRVEIAWHPSVVFVDCGANLESVTCPHCAAPIEFKAWHTLMDSCYDNGFPTLAVRVPCCGAETSLNALDYRRPCAFGRFQLAVWNPGRSRFTDEELTGLSRALGHPLRQVLAHQ